MRIYFKPLFLSQTILHSLFELDRSKGVSADEIEKQRLQCTSHVHLGNWVLTFEAPMFSVIVRHETKRSKKTGYRLYSTDRAWFLSY